jgi:thiaminase
MSTPAVVAGAIAELDRVSHGLSDDQEARLRRHFRTTSRYE